MSEAEKIIENANKHAEQTRIVTAFEAAQIIQHAIATANQIKGNLAPAGELTPDSNKPQKGE